jgi:hypothetical protein
VRIGRRLQTDWGCTTLHRRSPSARHLRTGRSGRHQTHTGTQAVYHHRFAERRAPLQAQRNKTRDGSVRSAWAVHDTCEPTFRGFCPFRQPSAASHLHCKFQPTKPREPKNSTGSPGRKTLGSFSFTRALLSLTHKSSLVRPTLGLHFSLSSSSFFVSSSTLCSYETPFARQIGQVSRE